MVLRDRVAMVTGGSSGIGRGICLELAREGAKVVVADIRETPKQGKYYEKEPALPTAAQITQEGGQALFVQADMGREEEVRQLIERSAAHFGHLDILVNNAGIFVPGSSQELAVADWDQVLGVDLRGVFLATKFALPHLKQSKAGRIVNIASVHAFGGGGGPAYAAAKAGVVNLTRDTAIEAGPDGVTVNAICPGAIETPIQDYLTPEIIEEVKRRTPLRRFGTPREIGRACVFLASDDAAWITGAALLVDGGLVAPVI